MEHLQIYRFILDCLEDQHYLKQVMFMDEPTFPTNGVVTKHNCCIWGSQIPHKINQQVNDSQKSNVWCGLLGYIKNNMLQ